jgi:small subunit ribosomal protein S8
MFTGLVNLCSHFQNAARANLGMTSFPNTRNNLNLFVAMHRQGLIAHITRGGPHPPDPETLLTAKPEPVTHSNVASRRLWVGLKYHDQQPVVKRLSAVSTPTRRITMKLHELIKIAKGQDYGYVRGAQVGELLFLTTDVGVLEIREAIGMRRGGCILCRAQ